MSTTGPDEKSPDEGDEEFVIEELESDEEVTGGAAAACRYSCGFEK